MRIFRCKKYAFVIILALLGFLLISELFSINFSDSELKVPESSIIFKSKEIQLEKNHRNSPSKFISWGTSTIRSENARAIVYLVPTARLTELGRSLRFLFANFNDRFRYPVILFHQGDLSEWVARLVLLIYLRVDQLKLIEILEAEHTTEFPPTLNVRELEREGMVFKEQWPHYQHMCAFWFRHVFLQSRLRHVKYIMRLDSDANILSNITYDMFEFMERNQIKYAYKIREVENDCCSKRMVEFVYNYANQFSLFDKTSDELLWLKYMSKPLLTENPLSLNPREHQPKSYYTNFELMNVPAFRDDPEVWRFIETAWRDPLLHLHGIYRLRWGDAPLRFQTVHLHSQLYQHIHAFCDLHYIHGSYDFPATCKMTGSQEKETRGNLKNSGIYS